MYQINAIKRYTRYLLVFAFLFISGLYANTLDRPKIGLVLSGGGAKGFAHIGTLKMLDSLQIPVDYIVGTSMGGILGALYSIGYNGYDLENLAFGNDWQEIFTDKPPRATLPYFQKKDTGKYQLKFGIKGVKPTTPSGLIFGQKISLLFSSLTFPYEKITDFDDLPIPFCCVAVDLVTGNQVVLNSGSLAKAMRATMAIPTVFSPVELGDSLLVDGGLLNNLPIDIVKEKGADIVIAVDVGSPLKERSELGSALAIMEQVVVIAAIAQWKQNIEKADILIRPNMRGFTSADFKDEKIQKIIQEGELAAHQSVAELTKLIEKHNLRQAADSLTGNQKGAQPRIHSVQITGHTAVPFDDLRNQLDLKADDAYDPMLINERIAGLKASGMFESIGYEVIPESNNLVRLLIRIKEKQIPVIHGIRIKGNRTLPFSFIYYLLGLTPGNSLDTDDLNRRIMELYGLGYFESIQYDIDPVGKNQVTLTLTVKEAPRRILKVGLRYDDWHKLVAAVKIQSTNLPLPGIRWENELQFAGLRRFSSKLYYPSRTLDMPVYPCLGLDYQDISMNIFDEMGNIIARYKDRSTTLGIGLGLLFAKSFNTEILYQFEQMDIKPTIALRDPTMFPEWKDKLRKIKATVNVDKLDNVLLPRAGFKINARYEGSFNRFNSEAPYQLFEVSADFYKTLRNRHTLRMYSFWGIGSSQLPVYKFFNQGRPYTFVGMEYDQMFGNEMSILRLDYRYQHKKDIFLKLMANVAFNLEYRLPTSVTNAYNLWGVGIGIKLLSPVGPIELIYGRGSKGLSNTLAGQNEGYFSLGYKF